MKFTSRAIAHLKAEVTGGKADVTLSHADTPVLRRFAGDLLVSYVVEEGDRFLLVQNRHLAEDGIDDDEMHRIGLDGLTRLIDEHPVRVVPHGSIFAVRMGGNFEASLLLCDVFWEDRVRPFVDTDYVAAVPARDVLAFCGCSSDVGVNELKQVIARVGAVGGDHSLSKRLYVRRQRRWQVYAD